VGDEADLRKTWWDYNVDELDYFRTGTDELQAVLILQVCTRVVR
jgi:hypothetical protein